MEDAHALASSVGYINDYCQRCVDGVLVCELDPVKGRILRVAKGHPGFGAGERIFAESPLLLVAESTSNAAFEEVRRLAKRRALIHDPIWYWCAMCSLRPEHLQPRGCRLDVPPASREQHEQLMLLCHPQGCRDTSDVAVLVTEFWPPGERDIAGLLQVLLLVWLHNCFEHTEDPVGFSTFFLPSFLSHDCRPNGMWHYEGNGFALRARQKIEPGEEVTVSYLAEEALLESTTSRRSQLQASKSFRCDCTACSSPVDHARGFACPSCCQGEMFPEVLFSDVEFGFRMCPSCGFLPTGEQAQQMMAQEAKIEELVREWDRKAPRAGPEVYLTVDAASRLQATLGGLLSARHWLSDKVRRQLISYYDAVGRLDLAVPLAQQAVQHVAGAWPGFTAIHAWSLEAQGDLELRLARFPRVSSSEVVAPESLGRTDFAEITSKVAPLYREAAEVLKVLFGEDHEFCVSMRTKCASLDKILKDHLS